MVLLKVGLGLKQPKIQVPRLRNQKSEAPDISSISNNSLLDWGDEMKNILITGKNSYIGTSLENWLMRELDKYKVDTVDMKDGSWKEKDFGSYDVVFHVAGIAHIKETNDNQDLYYKVNRD